MSLRGYLILGKYILRFFIRWISFIPQAKRMQSLKKSYVIVPCDPINVGESRGDEAMILATIQHLQKRDPGVNIHIVTANAKGNKYVENLKIDGVSHILCWNEVYPLEKVCLSIYSYNPKDVFILGADCMDGYYSPQISLMLIAIHHIFTLGHDVNSHLLAFSFNENPSPIICFVLKLLNNALPLNLRDQYSLERYKNKVGKANLLADTAFALQYEQDFAGFANLKKWVITQKGVDKTIIGFNIHPMLRKYNNATEVETDARIIANNLSLMMGKHNNIALVLIPHDARQGISDTTILSYVYDIIKNKFSDRIYYDKCVYRADQIKGICGLLDGVISSRMHLAIAALGRCIPVMAATYQGKFEGLFMHFNLPKEYLMTPSVLCSGQFQQIADNFLYNLPVLKSMIKKRVHKVTVLAEKNFE